MWGCPEEKGGRRGRGSWGSLQGTGLEAGDSGKRKMSERGVPERRPLGQNRGLPGTLMWRKRVQKGEFSNRDGVPKGLRFLELVEAHPRPFLCPLGTGGSSLLALGARHQAPGEEG